MRWIYAYWGKNKEKQTIHFESGTLLLQVLRVLKGVPLLALDPARSDRFLVLPFLSWPAPVASVLFSVLQLIIPLIMFCRDVSIFTFLVVQACCRMHSYIVLFHMAGQLLHACCYMHIWLFLSSTFFYAPCRSTMVFNFIFVSILFFQFQPLLLLYIKIYIS
jgi:hypothetical protein